MINNTATFNVLATVLSSPMEQFEIFPVFSIGITINNVIFYLLIGALISPILQYVGTARGRIAEPTGWGIISETLYRTVLSMVESSIGKNYTPYFPLIYTLFYLILFSNLVGLAPYSTTPTAEFVIT
jgi:F0F1-type ATP synthase membrane subunit a